MKLHSVIKRSNCVCWLNDDNILIYKKRYFCIYDLSTLTTTKLVKLSLGAKKTLLSFSRLVRRLFRLYPFSPCFINKTNEILFSFCGYIYCLDLKNSTIKRELKLNHSASRALTICCDNDGNAYFGEYPTKKTNEPICIYKRQSDKKWSIVYKFGLNEIRHIHLLKIKNNDMYCFTGDENNEVKILCFKNLNFYKEPECILSGSQKYRSCVAAFDEKAMFYLTDTPYYENKIYSYDCDSMVIKDLATVDGTVIYGVMDDQKLYFSTCVEGNLKKDKNGNNVSIPIDGTNGGIKSRESSLYSFELGNRRLEKLFSLKKDFLSIKYFGIGTFTFPCNCSTKYFAMTSSSTKKDETTFIFQKCE